jgi:hypothetical protein
MGLKNVVRTLSINHTPRVDKHLQAGVVIDDMVYEASKLLGNAALNNVMSIMDHWASSTKH